MLHGKPFPLPEPRSRAAFGRLLLAMGVAFILHFLFGKGILESDVVVVNKAIVVEIDFFTPPEPELPEPEPVKEPEPEPVKEPEPEPKKPVPRAIEKPISEVKEPVFAEPDPVVKVDPKKENTQDDDQKPTVAPPTTDVQSDRNPESLMRLPKSDGLMGRVLGKGFGGLSPSLGSLESALDYRADGPLSDAQRTKRNTEQYFAQALAADAVEVGLADDYFRELKILFEMKWKPSRKDLNDPSSITRIGFLKDFATRPAGMGELWETYLDVSGQYARGEVPSISQKKREHLREVLRSRKTAFKFSHIAVVVVTHAADGKVLTIEMPEETGQTRIDEGIKDAVLAAVVSMKMKPPKKLSRERSFRSRWRWRVTWKMIPPTSFLTGNSFDIGRKGVEMDVPMQIKTQTNIMLLSFDRPRSRP